MTEKCCSKSKIYLKEANYPKQGVNMWKCNNCRTVGFFHDNFVGTPTPEQLIEASRILE